MLKAPRILYFIKGITPQDDEIADAYQFGSNVTFRNAALVGTEGATEKCDGVAGAVPKLYAGLPDGKQVIAEYNAKIAYKAPVAASANPPAPPVPPAPPAPAAANDGWGKPPQV